MAQSTSSDFGDLGGKKQCSAAVPAAVVGASRPHRRGQDALATAGKMPALLKIVLEL
jgi:hypothetical protein